MPHQKCDCHDDASKGNGALSLLARDASRVVSGRVTKATARALGNYCATHACTQSEALRKALVILSANGDDPAKALASIAEILGVAPDATADEIQHAFAALVANLPDTGPPGSAEFADPVPPPPGTATTSRLGKALTARGYTEADLARAMRPLSGSPRASQPSAAPAKKSITELRADRELAAKLKARGIESPAAFEALKKKAVRRI